MTGQGDHDRREGETELCVLIDGEEKPISLFVAFDLAKIEAHAFMEFHGNHGDAKRAAERSAQFQRDSGFPSWFTQAYEAAVKKCIERITVVE